MMTNCTKHGVAMMHVVYGCLYCRVEKLEEIISILWINRGVELVSCRVERPCDKCDMHHPCLHTHTKDCGLCRFKIRQERLAAKEKEEKS